MKCQLLSGCIGRGATLSISDDYLEEYSLHLKQVSSSVVFLCCLKDLHSFKQKFSEHNNIDVIDINGFFEVLKKDCFVGYLRRLSSEERERIERVLDYFYREYVLINTTLMSDQNADIIKFIYHDFGPEYLMQNAKEAQNKMFFVVQYFFMLCVGAIV